MGREVKRVAAGFDWPLEQKWSGFLNPFHVNSVECPTNCEGGYSPEYIALKNKWHGYVPFSPEDRGSTPLTPSHPAVHAFASRNVTRSPGFYGGGEKAVEREATRLCLMWNQQWCHHLNQDDVDALIEGERLHDLTSVFTPGEGWKKKDPSYRPTAQEVNDWSIGGFGHDSINCWIVIGAELKRQGLETTCKVCNGKGVIWPSAEAEKQCDDWTPTEPPIGDWWQVWETVSEGSPVTPAFATREELIDYLVANGDAWDQKRGDGGWSRENAESFVGDGWAPSLIGAAGSLHAPRDGNPLTTATDERKP